MVESSIVVAGEEIIAASIGQPMSVEFDFESVWAFIKRTRFPATDLLWFHVHPPGVGALPSQQDLRCVKALDIAFGSVNNFLIMCFENDDITDFTGTETLSHFSRKDGYLYNWPEVPIQEHRLYARKLKILACAK